MILLKIEKSVSSLFEVNWAFGKMLVPIKCHTDIRFCRHERETVLTDGSVFLPLIAKKSHAIWLDEETKAPMVKKETCVNWSVK